MVSDGNLNGQDRPVISPPRPRRGRVLLRLLFTMVLIVGTAAITLIYSDELKRSWLAQLLGVQCDLSPGSMEAAQERIKQADAESAKGERKVLYWVDPMNPTMRSDKPGKAPCGRTSFRSMRKKSLPRINRQPAEGSFIGSIPWTPA